METLDMTPHQAKMRDSLERCKLFTGLEGSQVDEVARHGELLQFVGGELIARQGDRADAFFIIISGDTNVEMSSSQGGSTFVLTRLQAGDFFGEMATLLGSQRNANVVAVSPYCTVLRYSGEQFKNMLKNLPYFSAALAHSLALRLQKTSAQSSHSGNDVFDQVDGSVLQLIPEAFCMRHRVVPLSIADGALRTAFVDTPTPALLEKVQHFVPSLRLDVFAISHGQFDALFRDLVWPDSDRDSVGSQQDFSLEPLLAKCVAEGASDLHLATNQVPRWRIDGLLIPIKGYGALSSEHLNAVAELIIPSSLSSHGQQLDLDFAYELGNGERFRANIFRDINGLAIALRHIPNRVLSMAQLGAPKVLKSICNLPKGLFLVTGPTGSGKSTTLAAMISEINLNQKKHIITLEDPIEYRHSSAVALVNQREIGVHTPSFAKALRSALREDPDVVLVGEMRDLETIALAIEVAQTGHLVFATLHTTSAIGTIERIVGMFEPEKQAQIRDALSDVLVGVVSQTLLARKDGGRVAAYEVLMNSPAVANLIREMKSAQITSYLSTGRLQGNQTLESDLSRLVAEGKVTLTEARSKSMSPEKIG